MNAIAKAIELAGGPAKVAGEFGVSVQAVCFWRDLKRRMPSEHGAALEALTGGAVSRREMFPYEWRRIWPELDDGKDVSGTTQEEAAHAG